MNQKINAYIDVLFSGVPRSKRAVELREELLSNMNERYEDYVRSGMGETQAYSQTVANMGDVDEMIRDVMPDEDFEREARFYRLRNARNTAIGVVLYILGAMALIGFSIFAPEPMQPAGLLILLALAAVATGLIIYTYMSTPVEFKDFDEEAERQRRYAREPNARLLESLSGIYWSVMVIIYLAASFLTGWWHLTWIIWPVAAILSEVIKILFELRNHHGQ